MRLKCGYGIDLEQAQADGQISPEDADEIRHFGEFMRAIAGISPGPELMKIYAEFYPDEYALAMAEQAASKTPAPSEPAADTAPRGEQLNENNSGART